MKISRAFTSLFVAIAAFIVLGTSSFAQDPIQVSDQKAGSLLVFPFYGSDGAGGDTRMTITNIGPAPQAITAPGLSTAQTISSALNVHLFFLDSTCLQADVYLCFTKYQSYSFKASEWDPVTLRGQLIAIPVDVNGYPISYNGLIGNAFVNTIVNGSKWIDNYSPESFASIGDAQGFTAGQAGSTATLVLDNSPRNGTVGYDAPAGSFQAEFQSPVDSKNQAILTVGLQGTIGAALTGNAARGIAVIYRNDEKLFSYTMPGSGCSALVTLTDSNIRLVGGLSNSIGSGKTGTAIWNVDGAIGLFITPVQPNGGYQGIRTLHKRTAGVGRLTIPVFMPICI